jgi:hypothetical protein
MVLEIQGLTGTAGFQLPAIPLDDGLWIRTGSRAA